MLLGWCVQEGQSSRASSCRGAAVLGNSLPLCVCAACVRHLLLFVVNPSFPSFYFLQTSWRSLRPPQSLCSRCALLPGQQLFTLPPMLCLLRAAVICLPAHLFSPLTCLLTPGLATCSWRRCCGARVKCQMTSRRWRYAPWQCRWACSRLFWDFYVCASLRTAVCWLHNRAARH